MYKRWVFCLVIVIVAALAGCIAKEEPKPVADSTVTPAPTSPPPSVIFPVTEPTTVHVEIFASAFNPSILRVVNGTTVRWTNKDSATYIITGDGFRSPELNKRDIWNYTFNETGTFEYIISDHPLIKPGLIIVNMSRSKNNS